MIGQPDREQLLESVALYALGVLPREEAALIAAFIANDDDARREYLDLRAAADALAYTAEEPVDSATSNRMKERLMARVRSDAAAGRIAPRRIAAAYPPWMWGTGLAAAVAIVFSLVTVVGDVNVRGELSALRRSNDGLRSEVGAAQRVAASDRRTLTDLLASDAKRYTVPAGTIVVRRDRIYFAFSKLPLLPRGRVYQAWTAPKGATAMQPSVTFTPNSDGVAVVALPVDATRVGVVAVSVEPEGGSKAPTTTPTVVAPLT